MLKFLLFKQKRLICNINGLKLFKHQKNAIVFPSLTKNQAFMSVNGPLNGPLNDKLENKEIKLFLNQIQKLKVLCSKKKFKRDDKFWEESKKLFKSIKNNDLFDQITLSDFHFFVRILNDCILFRHEYTAILKQKKMTELISNDFWGYKNYKDIASWIFENLNSGKINSFLNQESLISILHIMNILEMYDEMTSFWKTGTENKNANNIFFFQDVLAIILPICYMNNTLNYDEIMNLFQEKKKSEKIIKSCFLASLGKISIINDDQLNAIYFFEEIVKLYDKNINERKNHISFVSKLHLDFIGLSKNIKVANHFFKKAIQKDLPYRIRLKSLHIKSLLENCVRSNQPYELIYFFWIETIKIYSKELLLGNISFHYKVVNDKFWKIFFTFFPKFDEKSYSEILKIINSYSSINSLDETFLNALIDNYIWNSKSVLDSLIRKFELHNIKKSSTSFRIILKTAKSIEYKNNDILKMWNDCIISLDNEKLSFIPLSFWFTLAHSTILSNFSSENRCLFIEIFNYYKDYMKDTSCYLNFLFSLRSDFNTINELSNFQKNMILSEKNNSWLNKNSFNFLKENPDIKNTAKSLFDLYYRKSFNLQL